MLVFTVPVLTSTVAFTVYVSSILFRFDPLFIVLTDSFPDVSPESMVFLSIRMAFTFLIFEMSRTLGYVFLVYAVIVDRAIQIINSFTVDIRSNLQYVDRIYQRYVELTLIYREMAAVADCMISLLYSAAFWIIIIGVWLIIRGYGLVPAYMYWMIVAMAPICFIFLFGMLLFVANIADLSKISLNKLCSTASSLVVVFKTSADRRKQRILIRKCKTLLPVAVRYIPVSQPVCRTFAKNWLQNGVDRLFDGIILI